MEQIIGLIKTIWGIIVVLKWLWPILFIAFLLEIFPDIIDRIAYEIRRRRRFRSGGEWRSDRQLLRWLRSMRPDEFGGYIADLFSKLGYKTEVTGGAYDEGVDVIAEKDSVKHYIQCKKFITQEVGPSAIRDFYGAIADHLAKGKGYFITTNKFTLEAERFAEDKPIELIDGFKLIEYIRLAGKSIKEANEKVCPKCGGRLEERIGKYGKFLGCPNYPKCQYTENIKK